MVVPFSRFHGGLPSHGRVVLVVGRGDFALLFHTERFISLSFGLRDWSGSQEPRKREKRKEARKRVINVRSYSFLILIPIMGRGKVNLLERLGSRAYIHVVPTAQSRISPQRWTLRPGIFLLPEDAVVVTNPQFKSGVSFWKSICLKILEAGILNFCFCKVFSTGINR